VSVFRPEVAAGTYLSAVPLASMMIRTAAVYVLVEALFLALIGALRGAGDTRWAMGLSVSVHWLSALVLFGALRILHWGPAAAWGAVVAVFVAGAFVVLGRYRQGCWRSMTVVEAPVLVPADTLQEITEV